MNKRIINPYTAIKSPDEYLCFGCSPYNKNGLKLDFFDRGENEIGCWWKPEKQFEGFHNVLHGGIQATLHDELAAWAVYTKCNTSGVTKSLKIEYLKPVFLSNGKILITATIEELTEKTARLSTKLYNAEEVLCSGGEIVYFIFPEAVARRKHMYPGVNAFYNDEGAK